MTQKAFAQGSAFPPTKPGVLRIYSMRFCPYAQRTRMVLLHKNIPHETVNINLKSKPDWFLALNPLGQVPVLQIDDKVVVESTATCDWLDDVYPENRLQPNDPYRRAWDRVLTEYMGKLSSAFFAILRSQPGDIPEKIVELEKHFKFYEDKLGARNEGPFFGGSQPAMIDYILWPHLGKVSNLGVMTGNSAAEIDLLKFPNLASWFKVMWELPPVKATTFDAETYTTFLKSSINNPTPDYDLGLEE
ncbi:omega glutathione s-transferase [Plakobranchus ocellatus]|uniref:Glutathione S-transferase omega n=1 Tax=Plakobranchus ocellatus TaxID=259542 RepID=A0AAV3Z9H9_9GAST|nr:omega glutathione s-transferase [Plakobranchus ocellatus]